MEAADFETGIFDGTDFLAEMLTHDFPPEETACPVFYRDFPCDEKKRIWSA